MPYTGNLVFMAQPPDARKLPPPSPRHATNEGDPSAAAGEHQVAAGTGNEYADTKFPSVIMAGWGMTLDTPASWAGAPPGGRAETPYRITWPSGNPHESDAVLSAEGANAQWYGNANRIRAHDGDDDHGYARTTFDPPPYANATQHRDEIDTDGLRSPYTQVSPEGAATKFVRGINSLPDNNPDRFGYDGPGFRRGRDRVRAWDNTVRAHISRIQSPQVLQPRDAYVPNAARRMVGDMMITPALPRTPTAPDTALLAATSYASSPASVIGGF